MKNLLLPTILFPLLLLAGCVGPSAPVAAPESTKTVSFNSLMGGKAPGVKASAAIPSHYIAAGNFGGTSTYWMEATEVGAAARTQDLPADSGYFTTKISTNEFFNGGRFDLENGFESRLQSAGLELLQKQRFQVGGHPALAFASRVKSNGNIVASLFVATEKGSQVAFVAYRPPNNDWNHGKAVWSRFLSSLN